MAIVIPLGRGVEDKELPTIQTYSVGLEAARKAMDLLRGGEEVTLVPSGRFSGAIARRPDSGSFLTEAEHMGAIARIMGVPKSAILIEKNSTTTLGNLVNVANLLAKSRVKADGTTYVVCVEAQLPRAVYMAQRIFGTDVIGIPVEDPDSASVQVKAIEAINMIISRVVLGGIAPGDYRGATEQAKRINGFKSFFQRMGMVKVALGDKGSAYSLRE